MRFGLDSFCQALQNFLLSAGRLLENAGEDSDLDMILRAVGKVTFPDEKMLTKDQETRLTELEKAWSDLVKEVRADTRSLLPGLEEFMKLVGKDLLRQDEPKPAVLGPWAEKHRCSVQTFYGSRGFRSVEVPPLRCTDDDLHRWFSEGGNLIFEPSDKDASVALFILQLPFKSLVEDPSQIAWEPVKEGRWLLVEAQERCPRVGERSYDGFICSLKPGQKILTLRQYDILWHLGSAGGEILDLETDTMLATGYGADGIVHAYGSRALSDLQFSIDEWKYTTRKHPGMGVRIARIIK
ncbi:MAG: hypothetical protein WC348_03895 [Patescibacteria group bacterium]|jgi:hypothetical protein